jgi:hypothetical protein
MIIVLNVKRPYGIEFTRNISVNYKLGIQVVSTVFIMFDYKKKHIFFSDCEDCIFSTMFLFTFGNNFRLKAFRFFFNIRNSVNSAATLCNVLIA